MQLSQLSKVKVACRNMNPYDYYSISWEKCKFENNTEKNKSIQHYYYKYWETYSWGSDYKMTVLHCIALNNLKNYTRSEQEAVISCSTCSVTFSMASETGSGRGPLFPMQVIQP